MAIRSISSLLHLGDKVSRSVAQLRFRLRLILQHSLSEAGWTPQLSQHPQEPGPSSAGHEQCVCAPSPLKGGASSFQLQWSFPLAAARHQGYFLQQRLEITLSQLGCEVWTAGEKKKKKKKRPENSLPVRCCGVFQSNSASVGPSSAACSLPAP